MRRIPWIDFLRSLALILMIIFHFVYDLDQWTTIDIRSDSPFWFALGKTSALLFIFLSGLSSGFSRHPLRNGFRLLAWGLVITLVTLIALPEEYVRFGILHFLGSMLVLSPLLRRLPRISLLPLAALAAGLGFYVSTLVGTSAFLLPLGIMYPGFASIDFYPLFPYSAVSILGIYCSRSQMLQQSAQTPDTPKKAPQLIALPVFQKISRRSLLIYLIHQPIILAALFGLQSIFGF